MGISTGDLYSKTTMPTKPVGATIIIPDFINRFSSDDVTFLYNQRHSSSAANKLSTANSKGSLSNVIAAAKGDTIRIRFRCVYGKLCLADSPSMQRQRRHRYHSRHLRQ